MAQLVTSLVIYRLNYCNYVLAGLASTLAPLQRVQNAVARLVLNRDRRSHITPALQQLHWLPVKYRIIFKITTLMHHILYNRCPSYLVDLVAFNTADSHRRQFRSSQTRAAVVKHTDPILPNKRAFSACGPNIWNSLPPAVRNIDSHPAFRRALKSHFIPVCFYCITFYHSVFTIDYCNAHSRPFSVCMTGHYNTFLSLSLS